MALFGTTPPTGGASFGGTPPTGGATAPIDHICPSDEFMAAFTTPLDSSLIDIGDPPDIDIGDPPDLTDPRSHDWPEWQRKYGCGLISMVMLNMHTNWEKLQKKYGKKGPKKKKKTTDRPLTGPRPGRDIQPDVMNPKQMGELADCMEKASKEWHKRWPGYGSPWTRHGSGLRSRRNKQLDLEILTECAYKLFNARHGSTGGGGPGGGTGDAVFKEPPRPFHTSGSPKFPPYDKNTAHPISMGCPPWCNNQKAELCYHVYFEENEWTGSNWKRIGSVGAEHHCSYCESTGCCKAPGTGVKQLCFRCFVGPGQGGGREYGLCTDAGGLIEFFSKREHYERTDNECERKLADHERAKNLPPSKRGRRRPGEVGADFGPRLLEKGDTCYMISTNKTKGWFRGRRVSSVNYIFIEGEMIKCPPGTPLKYCS